MKRSKIVYNITVGKADVRPGASAHVPGIFQGNHPHLTQRGSGQRDEGDRAEATARRSTGIRPEGHTTIDPRMPKLSPS